MSTAKVLPFPGVVHHKISGPSRGLATHGEEREPSPGSAWPWIIFSGAGGLPMARPWTTGEEILSTRWGNIPGLLLEAVRTGGIKPYDGNTLQEVPREMDPCLFCDHPGEGANSCQYAYRPESIWQNIEDLQRGKVRYGKLMCRAGKYLKGHEIEHRVTRAKGYAYRTQDVEAYERAHGLGPAAQVPAAPPSPLDREEAAPDREETPQEMVARMKQRDATQTEIIAEIELKWPKMKKYRVGAYAKGLDPGDPDVRKQIDQHYQRYKPCR